MKTLPSNPLRLSILLLLLVVSLLNQVHSQHRRYSFQEGDVLEYEMIESHEEGSEQEIDLKRKFRFTVNKVDQGQFHMTMQILNWSVPNLYSFSDQTVQLSPELRTSTQILWNFMGQVNAEINNPIHFILDSMGGIYDIKGFEIIQEEIIQAAHESNSYKYHKNFDDVSTFYGRQKYHYLISDFFPAVPGPMSDTIHLKSGELEVVRINQWLPQDKEDATRDGLFLKRTYKFMAKGAEIPQDTTNSMQMYWVDNWGYPSSISYKGYSNSYFTQGGFSKHNVIYDDPDLNIGKVKITNTYYSNQPTKRVTIKGTISNFENKQLGLKLPNNSISKQEVILEPNENGSFLVEFELDSKAGLVDLTTSSQDESLIKLFVQPGDTISLSADLTNFEEITFQGKTAQAQYTLNRLKSEKVFPYNPILAPYFTRFMEIEQRYEEYAELLWEYYISPGKQKDSTKNLLNTYKKHLQYTEGYLHDSYKRFVASMVWLNSLVSHREGGFMDGAEVILIDWDLYWFKAYWTERYLQSGPDHISYYADFEKLYPGTSFQKQLEKCYLKNKKWQEGEKLPKMKLKGFDGKTFSNKKLKKNYWGLIMADGTHQETMELITKAVRFNDWQDENLQFLVWSSNASILDTLSTMINNENVSLLAGPEKNQKLATFLKDYRFDYLMVDPNNRITSYGLDNLQNLISWPLQKIEEERTIKLKFFWYTAIGLILLAALLLISLRIRSKRKEIQLNQKRKIAQLEIDAVRSRMNPHFLFNALGSIQNLVNRGKSKEASLYLARFGELVRTILSQSSKSVIGLNEEIEMIRNYLHLEQLGTPFTFEINIESVIDPATIEVPPLLLQPHVENALLHGISSLGDKGLIQINFKRDDIYLICEIVDNGPGYKADSASQKGGLGQGWKLTHQRIQLMKEQYDEEVSVEVSSASEKSGTTVTFRLPMQNSSL